MYGKDLFFAGEEKCALRPPTSLEVRLRYSRIVNDARQSKDD